MAERLGISSLALYSTSYYIKLGRSTETFRKEKKKESFQNFVFTLKSGHLRKVTYCPVEKLF